VIDGKVGYLLGLEFDLLLRESFVMVNLGYFSHMTFNCGLVDDPLVLVLLLLLVYLCFKELV